LQGTAGQRELARLSDRYFSFYSRVGKQDRKIFIKNSHKRLPVYLKLFKKAGQKTGLDWRLLAALAYQESHWRPKAVSRTGVRGMMMLTRVTARRMGVTDRSDPWQSIDGGARYLKWLIDHAVSKEATPADTTWMALSAYNIGPGHYKDVVRLAKRLDKDDSQWVEIKQVLPLLSDPLYYKTLPYGKGRGGEALVLAENVRFFYHVLRHYYPV